MEDAGEAKEGAGRSEEKEGMIRSQSARGRQKKEIRNLLSKL